MPDKTNQSELDALIDDCLEGRLSEPDAAKLSAYLEQSAEARARYWEAASVHGLLEHVMQNASLRAVTGQALPIVSRAHRWLQWRSLTAAAMGLVIDPCCGSAGMFAFQVGIHDASPREEFLEVSVPWNRTSAVASQNLGKFSPIIAMTAPECQLEEQLIQA